MSELPTQEPDDYNDYIAKAGKELADQIPWEKTHAALYDETGALTTDGRIAQAAVNLVIDPALRKEHENGLLNALTASRVYDIDIAREAADKESRHRDFAKALNEVADTDSTEVDDSTDFQNGKFGVSNKRISEFFKKEKEYNSASKVKKVIQKLAGRPMPIPEITSNPISDDEVREYFRDEAHEELRKANDISDKVVKSYQDIEK